LAFAGPEDRHPNEEGLNITHALDAIALKVQILILAVPYPVKTYLIKFCFSSFFYQK